MAVPRGGGPGLAISFPQLQDLQSQKFDEARINGGMITTIDAADIPSGALQRARNARIQYDKTSRRAGTILLSPTAPDTNKILAIATLRKQDNTSFTYRFTRSSINQFELSGWQAITGTLIGTDDDRIRVANILNTFIFTNNGANKIQSIDSTAQTFADLSASAVDTHYRYVCGFFNRAVGAALRDTNEVQIGWSGDGNITVWDPSADPSAGNTPLVESTDDLADHIKGIRAFTNIMIIARERSIWYAQKQPSGTNPFYFACAVPGIGCDCPDSLVIALNGIIWADTVSRTVWQWTPGGQPSRLGLPIEDVLFAGLSSPEDVFASYDPIANRYSVGIPQSSSKLIPVFTYDFVSKSWAYSQYYDISYVTDIAFSSGTITIDSLGEGPIDALVGTIDDLSPTAPVIPTRMFGRGNGDIIIEDINATVDADYAGDPAADPDYVFDIVSKAFVLPDVNMSVARVVIEYVAHVGGQFQLLYSKSGGSTEVDDWILAKTIVPTILKKPQVITFSKCIKSHRFAWRLLGTDGIFDILSFEVHVFPSGLSRQNG